MVCTQCRGYTQTLHDVLQQNAEAGDEFARKMSQSIVEGDSEEVSQSASIAHGEGVAEDMVPFIEQLQGGEGGELHEVG